MTGLSYFFARTYLFLTSQHVHDEAIKFLRRMAGKGEYDYASRYFLGRRLKWTCTPARGNLLAGSFWSDQIKRAEVATDLRLCPICLIGSGGRLDEVYAIIVIGNDGSFFKINEEEDIWRIGNEEAVLKDLRRTSYSPPPDDRIQLADIEVPAESSGWSIGGRLLNIGKVAIAGCLFFFCLLADCWWGLLVIFLLPAYFSFRVFRGHRL